MCNYIAPNSVINYFMNYTEKLQIFSHKNVLTAAYSAGRDTSKS